MKNYIIFSAAHVKLDKLGTTKGFLETKRRILSQYMYPSLNTVNNEG